MSDTAGRPGSIVLLEQTATMVRRAGRAGIMYERAIGQVRTGSKVGRPKAIDALAALLEAGIVHRRGNLLTGAPPQLSADPFADALAAYRRRRAQRLTGARG